MTRIVCISDTHGKRLGREGIPIPDGDVLIHAGDLTETGQIAQVQSALTQITALPHPYKVIIAGNHDFLFERFPSLARDMVGKAGITYLEDSEVTLAGLRIYGSPWQPWFYDWAFNGPHGGSLMDKWNRIPQGLDILITHGPPKGVCDWIPKQNQGVGCEELRMRIEETSPRLHVCGHIHEGYGEGQIGPTRVVNASLLDGRYAAVNKPIVIDLP